MEKFMNWIEIKIRLHFKSHEPPLVTEGDIWWASLGENIGTEINGKGPLFTRPLIVLRKLSRETYFVVPVTTQIH
jgi:mRNA interferase MazF